MKQILLSGIFILSNMFFVLNAKERIGIVDTGLRDGFYNPKYLCDSGHFGNYKQGLSTHGTNVYNLVTKGLDASKFCVVYIKVESEVAGQIKSEDYIKGLDSLENVDYLNISITGKGFFKSEYLKIKNLLDKGTVIFVAAGNEGIDMDKSPRYPAALPLNHLNFIVVGNVINSNFGSMVDFIVNGVDKGKFFKLTGTSQSSPIALNHFLKSL